MSDEENKNELNDRIESDLEKRDSIRDFTDSLLGNDNEYDTSSFIDDLMSAFDRMDRIDSFEKDPNLTEEETRLKARDTLDELFGISPETRAIVDTAKEIFDSLTSDDEDTDEKTDIDDDFPEEDIDLSTLDLEKPGVVEFDKLSLLDQKLQQDIDKQIAAEKAAAAQAALESKARYDQNSRDNGGYEQGNGSHVGRNDSMHGGGHCFTGDVPVRMADGTCKPISDVKIGDNVRSFDANGQIGTNRVIHLHIQPNAEVYDLAGIGVTASHPFLSSDGIFRPIGSFEEADFLVREDGTFSHVPKLIKRPEPEDVYNLTVEGTHTYIAGGWRVHNKWGAPVVLDLDGDGVELVSQEDSHAFFDLDGDGFKENVGWVSSDDALLAIDIDGDGTIDKAEEVNFTLHHEDAETDLDGVRLAFDSNQDGVLDAQDERFEDFRVWRDADGDGVADEGELKTLSDAGISSIGLEAERTDQDIDGNILHRTTEMTMEDGTTAEVGDAAFLMSDVSYRENENGTLDFQSRDGSTAKFGTEGDDVIAAGDDAALIVGGAGDDLLAGSGQNDWIVGGDGADTLRGGGGHDNLFFDGQDEVRGGAGLDIAVSTDDGGVSLDLGNAEIEVAIGGAGDDSFTGSEQADVIIGGGGADVINAGAGDDLIIVDELDGIDGGSGVDTVIFETSEDVSFDLSQHHVEIAVGGSGDDTLTTSNGYGGVMSGGAGDDTISGSWNTDVLIGGAGRDILKGGAGNDTYRFGRGDGEDTVNDTYSWGKSELRSHYIGKGYPAKYVDNYLNTLPDDYTVEFDAGDDTLELGPGISPDDILFRRDGDDLVLALKDPDNPDAAFEDLSDQLRIEEWSDSNNRIEVLQFASGTTLDLKAMLDNLGLADDGTVLDVGAEMAAKLGDLANEVGEGGLGLAGASSDEILVGSDAEDVIVAGGGNDTVIGGDGDDLLFGQGGDDTLSGGEGSDLLDGGAGDDTLLSDGNDVLHGGAGTDTVKFTSDDGVQLDLSDAEIESVLGSLGDDELSALGLKDAIYMNGGAGNDILSSGAGEDSLLGGSGDDILDGGLGNDVLDGGAGDDRFVGNEGADTMLGGDGQDTVDYSGSDQGIELSLETGGTAGDAAGDTFNGIENVIGTNQDDVIAGDGADNTLDAGAGDDSLSGQDGDDYLLAGDGDDILDGGQGDDVLDGGAGADQLSGGDGQDQLTGGAGDDVLDGGDGSDVLDGGTGDDHLTGGTGADHLSGGEGNDILDAGEGVDLVDAGDGDDTIIGRGDGDVIDGGAGSDLLDYGQSDDGVRLDMSDTKGYETDHLEDRAQDIEAVTGSGFNDDLAGSALNETFEAGAGADTVSGRLGDDELSGGAGDDTLLGQQGDDVLHGSSGDDILSGGSGDDTLYGGEGDNLFFGGEGDDEAVFAGSRDDYDFVRDGDDLIVIGADGSTRLSDIETIRFDDDVFNVEDLLADEDIPVATENRQRRDEQYQTALAASVASAVALGGLANTYDNTAQAAERIEAAAANDPDIAEENIWVVEPLQGDQATTSVAGTSDDDLLLAEEPNGAAGVSIPGVGGLSGASSASGVLNGSSAGGYEADILPEMIGNVQSDLPVNDDGGSVSGEPGTTVNSLSPAEEVKTATIITRNELLEPNLAPEGAADFAQTLEDQEIRIRISDLLANDSDPENGALEFVGIGSVTGGTARVEGGYVIFSPARDFNGFANVFYRLRDNHGNIATAQLGIDVAEVNDAPSVVGEYVSGREDTVLRIALKDLLANDIDVDGDMLSITAITEVSSGSAEIDGDDLLFTPAPDWNGEAILRYAVSDGRGGQSIATLRIDVAAVNDAPDLQDDVLQTDEDQALHLNVADLLANDSDREGDTLAVIGVEAVSGGTVSLSGDTITFTPDADFNGIARFKYQVDDGNGGVSTAFANVTVTAVNDAPVIEVIPDTRTHYHQALALTALVSASDIDGDALYIELRDAESLGHFEVDGQAVPDRSIVRVLLSEIDRVRFVPVAYPDSVETLQIRAFDGEIYTDWKPLAVTADNTVLGTEGADELMAGNIGDILDGFAGNDTLTGGSGDDLLLGRDGDDTLLGGAGNDTLYGGEGDDTIVAGAGNNSIWAGDGNDRIEISNLDDLTRLDAGDGRDRLILQTDEDVTLDISTVYAEEIQAGAGNDVLYSNGTEDLYIHAGDGDDVLLGGDGNDTLIGGDGKDRIEGGAGDDVIEIGLGDNLADIDGGSGNDTLMVSDGVDITIDMTGTGIENVVGGAGDETVTDLALEGSNVSLGAGGDTVIAGSGADILEGGAGSDTLDYSQSTSGININLAENSVTGGTGDGDTISGFENVNDTAFDDLIIGDAEDNRLLSSSGTDDLTGGDGADEFVINLDPSATGTVRIRDFSPINGDMLSLTGLGAAGTIAAITNALASQTMNEDGDVTLSFAAGRSVIFEGLGEPFTAEMTTAPVVVAEETISDEQSGELKIRVALSRAVDEDVTFNFSLAAISSGESPDVEGNEGQVVIMTNEKAGGSVLSVYDDDNIEGLEEFGLTLETVQSQASGAIDLVGVSSRQLLIDQENTKGAVDPQGFGLVTSGEIVRQGESGIRNLNIDQGIPPYEVIEINAVIESVSGSIGASGLSDVSFDYSVVGDFHELRFYWRHVVDGQVSSGWRSAGTLGWPRSGAREIAFGETFTEGEIEIRMDLYVGVLGGGDAVGLPGHFSLRQLKIDNIVGKFLVDELLFDVGDIDGDGVSDGMLYDVERDRYIFYRQKLGENSEAVFEIVNDTVDEITSVVGEDGGSNQRRVFIAAGNLLFEFVPDEKHTEFQLSELSSVAFPSMIHSVVTGDYLEVGRKQLLVGLGDVSGIKELKLITLSGDGLQQSDIDSARTVLLDQAYSDIAYLGDTNGDGIDELGLLSSGDVTRIEQNVFLRDGDIIQLGSSADDTLIAMDHAVISGLNGDDDYSIQTGVGDVTIVNEGSSLADHDRIVFEDGVSAEQLWFTRNGNDLLLEVLGTDDSVTVADWYGGDLSAKIDAITMQDGSELAGYEIEKIVSLMAAIDKPEDSGAVTETFANAGLTDDVEELWASG